MESAPTTLKFIFILALNKALLNDHSYRFNRIYTDKSSVYFIDSINLVFFVRIFLFFDIPRITIYVRIWFIPQWTAEVGDSETELEITKAYETDNRNMTMTHRIEYTWGIKNNSIKVNWIKINERVKL